MKTEQGAQEYVVDIWDSVPDDVQHRCLKRAHFDGQSSYSLLKKCVVRELELRRIETVDLPR